MKSYVPEGTNKAYNVQELLNGVYIESAGDQEKVLAMAKADSKDGGIRWLAKKLNRYLEVESELFGIKLKYQNVIEDVLNRPEK